jgi:hypothetical protein
MRERDRKRERERARSSKEQQYLFENDIAGYREKFT